MLGYSIAVVVHGTSDCCDGASFRCKFEDTLYGNSRRIVNNNRILCFSLFISKEGCAINKLSAPLFQIHRTLDFSENVFAVHLINQIADSQVMPGWVFTIIITVVVVID